MKVAKNFVERSVIPMDVLYLNMIYNKGNVDKKVQLSIFNNSRDNPHSDGRTDRRTFRFYYLKSDSEMFYVKPPLISENYNN